MTAMHPNLALPCQLNFSSRWLILLVSLLVARLPLAADTFTVVVYNVENLFDLDGVAVYDDYQQAGDPHGWGLDQFVRKVHNIGETLAAVNDGAGPEIILFQEIELDRTPYDTLPAAEFLRRTAGRDLRTVLETEPRLRRVSAEVLLLKHLQDIGLGPYHIALPDFSRAEAYTAITNVVFSRYPVLRVQQRPSHDARDLLAVTVDIDGHPLVLINNHWKSGASNPATEPTRVQNARVVLAFVEGLLLDDPSADIIVGGDLNSYYNHRASFGTDVIPLTGVNCVLGSQGDELAIRSAGGPLFYNLWHELPLAERGSETWRGYWGTLMQMLMTRGLYDYRGVQYVDNSFFRVVLPERNVGVPLGQPRAWTHFGGGSGFSDHLAIGARFRVVLDNDATRFKELKNPSREATPPAERPPLDFAGVAAMPNLPNASLIAGLTDAELALRIGDVFRVRAPLTAGRPATVSLGNRTFVLHSFDREVSHLLAALPDNPNQSFIGELSFHRGRLQWIVHHPSWLD
jgi:hypothetical protein